MPNWVCVLNPLIHGQCRPHIGVDAHISVLNVYSQVLTVKQEAQNMAKKKSSWLNKSSQAYTSLVMIHWGHQTVICKPKKEQLKVSYWRLLTIFYPWINARTQENKSSSAIALAANIYSPKDHKRKPLQWNRSRLEIITLANSWFHHTTNTKRNLLKQVAYVHSYMMSLFITEFGYSFAMMMSYVPPACQWLQSVIHVIFLLEC